MDDIYLEKPFPAGINNTRCLNQDDAKSLLLDVKEVFDKNGMEFFLVFGTLLGAYRENNFIKHDTDIDIAVIGDGAEDAIDELIKNGRFSDKNIKSFNIGDKVIVSAFTGSFSEELVVVEEKARIINPGIIYFKLLSFSIKIFSIAGSNK